MKDYDPKEIEPKWQAEWEKQELYHASDDSKKEKYYLLVEFPYPSGNLHVGHWYAFGVPDIHGRYMRMKGYNVMYPIGFDAFGLPAENAAIKRGINPRVWTFENIEYMKKQLRSMGAGFDWKRLSITAEPEYYRWTQWQFIQFLKKGLGYQAEREVNWCPIDKTVLANEQVIGGRCERCGSEVEKRNLLQWNLKITDYAERLLDGLDKLDWPDPIKEAQRNWIGKSAGANIQFAISNSQLNPNKIEVFTTRPDTIFGATYLVLAPEHPAIENWKSKIENWSEVEQYIKKTQSKTEIERLAEGKEKTGVKLDGVTAINPATRGEIPVFIADYVLPQYGTGAIMAVPAHDERDFDFAKKFDLPIVQVVMPDMLDKDNPPREGKKDTIREVVHAIVRNPKDKTVLLEFLKGEHWGDKKPVNFIIGGIEGEETAEEAARREIEEETGYTNIKFVQEIPLEIQPRFFAAHKDVNRKIHVRTLVFDLVDESRKEVSKEEQELHDLKWLPESEVSGAITIPDDKMTWKYLYEGPYSTDAVGVLINSLQFNGRDSIEATDDIIGFIGGKKAITYKLRDWVVSRQRYWGVPIPVIHCEKCGAVPVPEEDLPVLLPDTDDYLPRDDGQSPLAKVEGWVNVKCPKCGRDAKRDTDTLDTFVDSSWYFLRYADPKDEKQFAGMKKMEKWMPVDRYSGGAEHTTMHVLYSRFWYKALFDLGLVPQDKSDEPYMNRMNRGLILGPDGEKMSKSRGNVIDPDKEVANLGADTLRIYLAFIGPYNEVGAYPWNPNAAVGVRRFLEKVWRMKESISDAKADPVLMNKTIKKVSEDLSSMKMNTAVSSLMILSNEMEKNGANKEYYETVLKLLAPFAPHIAEELWHELGHNDSIHKESWPEYDEKLLEAEEVTLAVQVNGKVRASIKVSKDEKEPEIRAKTLALPEIQKWLDGKEPKKVIVVPGKIVSIVS